jgi:hypothetical protein
LSPTDAVLELTLDVKTSETGIPFRDLDFAGADVADDGGKLCATDDDGDAGAFKAYCALATRLR